MVKRFGNGGVTPGALVLDDAGGTILTGDFSTITDFGAGPVVNIGDDAYVARLDPAGQLVWLTRFGSPKNGIVGQSVVLDATGNVFVSGQAGGPVDFGGGSRCAKGLFNQIFLVKLDPAGKHLYSVCLGAPSGNLRGVAHVAVDPAGNAFVAAEVRGTIELGGVTFLAPPWGSAAVIKVDPAGNVLWGHVYGTPDSDVAVSGVAAIGNGDVVVTGEVTGSIDFGKGPLEGQTNGALGIFLARLDGDGNSVWSKLFGSQLEQHVAGVAVGPSGQIAITGFIWGSVSFGGAPLVSQDFAGLYVATFDGAGAALWSRGFETTDLDEGRAIGWGDDGTITLVSNPGPHIDFGCGDLTWQQGFSFALTRFDSAGHVLGARLITGGSFAGLAVRGSRFALTGTGDLDPLDLGAGPAQATGHLWTATYAP
jgi:hypothetical protein